MIGRSRTLTTYERTKKRRKLKVWQCQQIARLGIQNRLWSKSQIPKENSGRWTWKRRGSYTIKDNKKLCLKNRDWNINHQHVKNLLQVGPTNRHRFSPSKAQQCPSITLNPDPSHRQWPKHQASLPDNYQENERRKRKDRPNRKPKKPLLWCTTNSLTSSDCKRCASRGKYQRKTVQ